MQSVDANPTASGEEETITLAPRYRYVGIRRPFPLCFEDTRPPLHNDAPLANCHQSSPGDDRNRAFIAVYIAVYTGL
jgi:hypothetical protein